MPEMISVEQARDLVLSHVSQLPAETVPVLDAAGRVAAVDLKSDIDISPFAHAAMDGFAMRAAQLQSASPESPVELDVIAEVAAGDTFEGDIPEGACVRIMTGAPLPAAARAAGALPTMLPIVEDSLEALKVAVLEAVREYDFVVTSGGASDGDFDFIKPCVEQTGELLMTRVNMRPGKAQTFGLVNGTPVFGLPGNPAAAYCGFEMLIRPALRKMQGYSNLQRPLVKARLARDAKKGDARRIYLRATITKDADGAYAVEPAKNQSSGLFGVIQRSNCLAVLPEGGEGRTAGSLVECILLDVNEDVCL